MLACLKLAAQAFVKGERAREDIQPEQGTGVVELENLGMKSVLLKALPVLILFAFFASGCASSPPLDQLSAHYKKYRDYESLVALLPYLNYTTTRAEVENLLGEPTCNYDCFYLTDESFIVFCPDEANVSRLTCQSFPLVLTVDYVRVDANFASPQDRLSSFKLIVMGE